MKSVSRTEALALHTSPELAAARARLADLRAQLADCEVELADLRAQLRAFEAQYMHRVGTLYAALDDWEARIAEREVALYDSTEARQRAAEARARATETYNAAYNVEDEPEEFAPPASLKALFREVAKRVHPDFARDDAEQAHFTRLMAQANAAYLRGEAHVLQQLLDDHRELNEAFSGAAAELERAIRQAAHAERDLAALDAERRSLLTGEIGAMRADAEAARSDGRDLLAELAAGVREKVADAERRFIFIDRQVNAQR